MADVPERLPQREPGAHLPEQCADFPTPWPIPPNDVPGWICPSEQWPAEQEPDSGWPGHDRDVAGVQERDEKDPD
jgi:hypothetical protein